MAAFTANGKRIGRPPRVASTVGPLAPPVVVDNRTDLEIVDEIKSRFDLYYSMMNSSGGSATSITSLIVSGSAGVGKSYTAEWALERLKQKFGIRYQIIRGMISPIDLYAVAYKMRNEGDIIVLDDADSIFDDETGLNILKSLLDTSVERKVSWYTDHHRFSGEGPDKLPKDYTYRGSMVFLTNKNFQNILDMGKGQHIEHIHALMSRSIYLDLKMHSRREVCLWARHLVLHNHILQQIGLNVAQEREVVDWLVAHQNDLRELSIRTAIKLGKILRIDPATWQNKAAILLLR